MSAGNGMADTFEEALLEIVLHILRFSGKLTIHQLYLRGAQPIS